MPCVPCEEVLHSLSVLQREVQQTEMHIGPQFPA